MIGRVTAILFVLATLLAVAGCGNQEFAEVEGVVTRKGQPLNNLQVIFMPDPELGTFGPSSRAFTDEEGRYYVKSARGQDGAIVGQHRVCIRDISGLESRQKPGKIRRPEAGAALPRVPAAYASATATPLRAVEVKPGKQTLDFEIK